MTKVVINSCYGGFSLSEQAIKLYFQLKGWNLVKVKSDKLPTLVPAFFYKDKEDEDNFFDDRMIPRDDPDLVKVVEELGELAYGDFAKLKVIEIPNGIDWYVEEYDGYEHIAERHKTWW